MNTNVASLHSAIDVGKGVFNVQSDALRLVGKRLDSSFEHAVELMLDAKGPVIVSGMGKSGIIGHKIAATLASTGTAAYWVHPGEAYHGDLGMFAGSNLALLISYSGETDEVIRLIPSLKRFGITIIGMVGDQNSTLARHSDAVLDISVEREACPNNLAPTTSTTVTAAMGDALAVALIDQRHFLPQDFAVFHPGGSLGRRLLTHVADVMHKNLPICAPGDNIRDVIITVTKGELGIAAIKDNDNLIGIITDGDLRRAFFNYDRIDDLVAEDIMSCNPHTVLETDMFADAEAMMLSSGITALLVINHDRQLTGILKLLDSKRVI